MLVILPDGTTNYAFGRSDFDRINNVEGLDLDPAPQGTLTIKVIGYNMPSGPQPYALVIRTSVTSSLRKGNRPRPGERRDRRFAERPAIVGQRRAAPRISMCISERTHLRAQASSWARRTRPGSIPAAWIIGKTYYWRIDAINPGGTVTGDVWSFTTEAPVIFSEGFENGGAIPAGWTQTYTFGARDWVFISGG